VCGDPHHGNGHDVSRVITLYITPVVYTYFDELQDWLSRRRLARTVPQEARSTQPPVESDPVARSV
jgi:hypothetical protein